MIQVPNSAFIGYKIGFGKPVFNPISTYHQISVVERVGGLLELLVGEPEADVPRDEPGEGGVEALVEGSDSFIAERLDGAVEGATVLARRAVHEPRNKNIN